jgi:hypothetical protein
MDNQNNIGEDKKDKNLLIIIGVLVVALLVSVYFNISNDSANVAEENQDTMQARDYINILYTNSGIVPRNDIRTSQKNMNFVNRTYENVTINVIGAEGYSETINIGSGLESRLENVPAGEYTVTESGGGESIDVIVIE